MPEPQPKLILASASPRRSEILETLGLSFEVIPSDAAEEAIDGEAPSEFVVRLAQTKAKAVADTLSEGLVIGADTVVVVDGRALGKPADAVDAIRMLHSLRGRWHAVMTGLALHEAGGQGRRVADCEKTLVRFRDLGDAEIEDYVASGEAFDKAGAYAIQGRGMLLVDEIAGNYHNVVGLPPTLLARLARRFGVTI